VIVGADWTSASVAGAFVLGAVFGVIVAVRLVAVLLEVAVKLRDRLTENRKSDRNH
jgi:hypothetical protein